MKKQQCAICGAEATQTHHLSYDPEISIHVCVPCHIKLHKHGVGRAKGQQQLPIIERKKERELWLPLFTTKEIIDGVSYITSLSKTILFELVCPNCEGKGLWQVFMDKENPNIFLRCGICGVDFEIRVAPRTVDQVLGVVE